MDVERAKLAALWIEYAEHARTLVEQRRQAGDRIGAILAGVRGKVRRDAARMLDTSDDLAEIAKVMHTHAVRLRQRDMPLVEYDAACVAYTQARTWQACAREVDPSLPEIQPRWD